MAYASGGANNMHPQSGGGGTNRKDPNIGGRLPENSRNSFVDQQSKKTVKKTDQKNSSFH